MIYSHSNILICLVVIILIMTLLSIRKSKGEYFGDLNRYRNTDFNEDEMDEQELDEDELDELENEPSILLSEAIFSKDLNTVQSLYQDGMRFTMWNLDDAIRSRYLPVVNFILDRITIPIHQDILTLAIRLNYDENIIRKIRSKM